MEDQHQDPNNSPSHASERPTETVRSRWTPKPEQILILESIFNSGMVNPPKDETVRIRKLLEKFGSVGDANVFYWFQNRRSRSRRRQRQQMQASLEQRNQQLQAAQQQVNPGGGAIAYDQTGSAAMGFTANSPCFVDSMTASYLAGSSSSCGVLGGQEAMAPDDLFAISSQMTSFPEIDQSPAAATSVLYLPDASNLNYQSGLITVFINGVATEVPRGALDMKRMFGDDIMLVHSSGIPVPIDDYGYLMQSLQHGESYFTVTKTI